jgi:hypothetical protein
MLDEPRGKPLYLAPNGPGWNLLAELELAICKSMGLDCPARCPDCFGKGQYRNGVCGEKKGTVLVTLITY